MTLWFFVKIHIMYACVYIYAHIHMYIHTHVNVWVHMYTHICTCLLFIVKVVANNMVRFSIPLSGYFSLNLMETATFLSLRFQKREARLGVPHVHAYHFCKISLFGHIDVGILASFKFSLLMALKDWVLT